VLVDFWTYSCINCLRTVPYLEKWYQAYQGDGLVIVGVNTPEFAFEHDPNNVRAAVRDLGITYPVTLDNDYFTWNAYQNNSWPADYLVDRNGYLRYVALGEGDYDKTESAIQTLLGLNSQLQTPTYRVPITANQTPETYFGIARQSGLSSTVSSKPNRDGSYLYTATPVDRIEPNTWTLGGNWTVSQQAITAATDGATLSFKFSSKDVYAVATGNGQKMAVGLEDNSTNQFGADAPMGMATIAASRLYHIVSLKQFGVNTVTLHVPVGVSLYTFTFGS
jgi:thiol-disulfide isomerase/thioredoxin